MSIAISIPERNRAVKRLLEKTYGKGAARVFAGTGTARHWVTVTFLKRPKELEALTNYSALKSELVRLIDGEGIDLHSYSYDDGTGGEYCLTINFPHAALRDQ